MSRVRAGAVDVEYEVFGRAYDPLVLLVEGLGGQLIGWDEPFCVDLAARGLRVIRYDNRDAGLSSAFDDLGVPDAIAVLRGEALPPYTVDDMADDAVALLDALGVAAAHVVGKSMGGMIAQLVAIRHPRRVLSLVSICSGAGGDTLVPPTDAALEQMTAQPAASLDEQIARSLDPANASCGPAYPADETWVRRRAAEHWERGSNADGVARQMAAVLAAPSRVDALRNVRIPTLVIHGTDDQVVPVDNGRITAAAIPGSRLVEVEGLGHDLPPAVWRLLVDEIGAHVAAAPRVVRG